ncbi:MAG: 50S ribosomal protein L25 [Armatimonadota bacterium]|nr:50S ribosomal protein L25 [Armatimonadota bacterium]
MAITLHAQSRVLTGKKVKSLRREGLIPAVISGHNIPGRQVAVQVLEYTRLERRMSPTTLMDVVVDGGAPVKALLHKVQLEPRTHKPLHLELQQVRMDEMIKAEVPLHLDGVAPAVEMLDATVVLTHSTVEIRASPDHLVTTFHVDLSSLRTFDDHIRAGDLKMPEGVELLTDPDAILVSVIPPSVEEEEPVAEGETEPAEAGTAPAA